MLVMKVLCIMSNKNIFLNRIYFVEDRAVKYLTALLIYIDCEFKQKPENLDLSKNWTIYNLVFLTNFV